MSGETEIEVGPEDLRKVIIDNENLVIEVESLKAQLADLREDFHVLRRAIAMGPAEGQAEAARTMRFIQPG